MKKWEADKWKHFWVGIPLGFLLLSGAGYFFKHGLTVSVLIAFALLVLVCYGFELLSLITGKGHYDIVDVIAGVIGGMIGLGIALVMFI